MAKTTRAGDATRVYRAPRPPRSARDVRRVPQRRRAARRAVRQAVPPGGRLPSAEGSICAGTPPRCVAPSSSASARARSSSTAAPLPWAAVEIGRGTRVGRDWRMAERVLFGVPCFLAGGHRSLGRGPPAGLKKRGAVLENSKQGERP